MENVCVIPPACAVMVAVCAVAVTLETVALNRLRLIAPDFSTVTLLGTIHFRVAARQLSYAWILLPTFDVN